MLYIAHVYLIIVRRVFHILYDYRYGHRNTQGHALQGVKHQQQANVAFVLSDVCSGHRTVVVVVDIRETNYVSYIDVGRFHWSIIVTAAAVVMCRSRHRLYPCATLTVFTPHAEFTIGYENESNRTDKQTSRVPHRRNSQHFIRPTYFVGT